MSTTIGTLTSLAIYVALVAVGAVIGSQCGKRGVALPWLGKFQFVALMILIVTLGIKLGANVIALVLPLLFVRPILTIAEFFRKKGV